MTNTDMSYSNTSNEMPGLFTPECEVMFEGGPSPEQLALECKKNPGHPTFIPVKDFKMEHLPPDYRTDKYMNDLQVWCNRTVKVSVSYTSRDRPDVYPGTKTPYPYSHLKGSNRAWRCGTGFLTDEGISRQRFVKGKPCPCHVCRKSERPKMEYWQLFVNTAVHVIFDDSEASNSVFELFYDSEDREDVKYLYGSWVVNFYGEEEKKLKEDKFVVVCVTHDKGVVDMVSKWKRTQVLMPLSGVIISHPHGRSKQITVGNILHYTVPTYNAHDSSNLNYFGRNAKYRLPKTNQEHEVSSNCSLSSLEVPQQSESNDLKLEKEDEVILQTRKSSTVTHCERKRKSFPPCPMVPGIEYLLPYRMSYSLPANADYMCRYKNNTGYWITFSPGTRFSPLGRNDCCLPPETEFYLGDDKKLSDGDGRFSTGWCRYVTYDIPTCPGSSGAPVLNYDGVMSCFPWVAHAGALDIEIGNNCSVYHNGSDDVNYIVYRLMEHNDDFQWHDVPKEQLLEECLGL